QTPLRPAFPRNLRNLPEKRLLFAAPRCPGALPMTHIKLRMKTQKLNMTTHSSTAGSLEPSAGATANGGNRPATSHRPSEGRGAARLSLQAGAVLVTLLGSLAIWNSA